MWCVEYGMTGVVSLATRSRFLIKTNTGGLSSHGTTSLSGCGAFYINSRFFEFAVEKVSLQLPLELLLLKDQLFHGPLFSTHTL